MSLYTKQLSSLFPWPAGHRYLTEAEAESAFNLIMEISKMLTALRARLAD
jgi:hypothetical protein